MSDDDEYEVDIEPPKAQPDQTEYQLALAACVAEAIGSDHLIMTYPPVPTPERDT